MNQTNDIRNITIFVTGLGTGGAEMMLLKLASNLPRDKAKLRIVSLMHKTPLSEKIEEQGVDICYLRLHHGVKNWFLVPFRLISFLYSHPRSVYQGWMYHGNLASHLAKLLRFPLAHFLAIRQTLYSLKNESFRTQKVIRIDAFMSRFVDKTLYVAKTAVPQHVAVGYCKDNVQVIPNGFDVDFFRPNQSFRNDIRKELGISPADFVVGHVARLHKMKGHEVFFESIVPLLQKFPSLHLIVVGKGVSPEGDWNDFLTSSGCLNRMHFLGERSDLQEVTNAFDIACSSSLYGEGFSNAIGEAMATGVPSVVTDVGDSAWIVGDTGVVVPPNDVLALREGLEKMITLSSESMNDLKVKARQRIVEKFSIKSIVKIYCDTWGVS